MSLIAATDFSDAAEVAVGRAARIARDGGATLVLAHAFDSPGWAVVAAAVGSTDRGSDVRGALMTELQREARALSEKYDIASRSELLDGPASRELSGLAQRIGASLIVLGAHGEHWVHDLFVGGTVTKLAAQTSCPVLVSKLNADRPYRTVLAATDFSDAAARAARAAYRLAPQANARVVRAYLPSYEARMRSAGFSTQEITQALDNADDVARAALERFATVLGPDQREWAREYRAVPGHPASVVVELAAGGGADLVAIGRHGGSALAERILGSVAERVLHAAECDVLVSP